MGYFVMAAEAVKVYAHHFIYTGRIDYGRNNE